jgi:DNA end-binding protein Ku
MVTKFESAQYASVGAFKTRTKKKRRAGRFLVEREFPDIVESEFLNVWSMVVAPRAYWKGYLKLSLVSCPIALFPATSEREKISFHQLNKETGNRIRYKKVDAETGDEVDNADIVKGYEVAKGEYIELDPEEIEAVAIESKRVIDIEEFVPRSEIDELYLRDPYYIVPDGEVGQQAFAVIRDAIRKEGIVALGKVVFTSREHIIALEARGKGMVGVTLRYPYEVRNEEEYFDTIEDQKIPKDMIDLAIHIVETKAGHFKPQQFKDEYEDALKDLLRRKQKGEKIERPKERAPSNVINLMDALRQSVKAGGSGGSAGRRSSRPSARAQKKATRSHARQKKAS